VFVPNAGKIEIYRILSGVPASVSAMNYLASSPRRASDGKAIYPRGAAPWGLWTEQQLRENGMQPGAPLRAYVEGGTGAIPLYSVSLAVPIEHP